MTRAVVDTSVFVSAFIGRDDAAPARLLRAARERRFTIIASPQLIQELTQVLDRPKFRAWSAHDRAPIFVGGVSLDRDLLEAGLSIRCLTPTDFLVALESPSSAT